MSTLLKKKDLQGIVEGYIVTLGSDENLEDFMQTLENYHQDLLNADELTSDEQECLQEAQDLIEMQRNALVNLGILSQTAFDAIEPDETGASLQNALAVVQKYTGSTKIRRNGIKIDFIQKILGEVVVPLIVSDGTVRYGVKSSPRGKNQTNPDRKSVKSLPIGLKHSVFKAYGKVWYQVFTCPSGWRIFNLTTREEMSDPGALPQTSSAAQQLITVYGDAFRGYSDALPPDVGVVALVAKEISDVVVVAETA